MMECNHCAIMRPTTAMHCYECGVCVDHVSTYLPVIPSHASLMCVLLSFPEIAITLFTLFVLLFTYEMCADANIFFSDAAGPPLSVDWQVHWCQNFDGFLLVSFHPLRTHHLCGGGVTLLHLLL